MASVYDRYLRAAAIADRDGGRRSRGDGGGTPYPKSLGAAATFTIMDGKQASSGSAYACCARRRSAGLPTDRGKVRLIGQPTYPAPDGRGPLSTRGLVSPDRLAGCCRRSQSRRRRALEEGPLTPRPSGPHCHIMCEFGSAVWKRSADKTIAVSLPVFFHQWDTRWFSAIASPASWINGSLQVLRYSVTEP